MEPDNIKTWIGCVDIPSSILIIGGPYKGLRRSGSVNKSRGLKITLIKYTDKGIRGGLSNHLFWYVCK